MMHKHALTIEKALAWLLIFRCTGCEKRFHYDKFRIRLMVKGQEVFDPTRLRTSN